MQVGSRRLGQGVVGGVSDQQVAEAEGVVSGELRRVGTDQALADERGEARRHRAAVRERLDRAAVEDLALDRAPLQHGALARPRAGRAARRGALAGSVGRRPRPRLSAAIATISVTNRGFPPEARAIFARSSSVSLSGISASNVCFRQRLEPERDRPLRAALGQLRPGEAEEQDRRAGREQGDVLDQVEERLLSPLNVVEDADERFSLRLLLEQLAERPGDLLGRGALLSLPEQGAERGRCRRDRRAARPAASAPRPPANR